MKKREIHKKAYKLLAALMICSGISSMLFLFSNHTKVIHQKPNYRAIYHFTTPDK